MVNISMCVIAVIGNEAVMKVELHCGGPKGQETSSQGCLDGGLLVASLISDGGV